MKKFLLILLIGSASSLGFVSTSAAVPTTETNVTLAGTAAVPVPSGLAPCTGAGTAIVTFNAVFHMTDLGPGEFGEIENVVSNIEGTFVLTPTSGPTFTGHFFSGFQLQSTPPGKQFNVTSELIVVGTGSDGSQWTFVEIMHVTSTPAGDITVSFDTPTCISA